MTDAPAGAQQLELLRAAARGHRPKEPDPPAAELPVAQVEEAVVVEAEHPPRRERLAPARLDDALVAVARIPRRAVGQHHDPRRRPEPRVPREHPAAAEDLVVGVRRDDQHALGQVLRRQERGVECLQGSRAFRGAGPSEEQGLQGSRAFKRRHGVC